MSPERMSQECGGAHRATGAHGVARTPELAAGSPEELGSPEAMWITKPTVLPAHTGSPEPTMSGERRRPPPTALPEPMRPLDR